MPEEEAKLGAVIICDDCDRVMAAHAMDDLTNKQIGRALRRRTYGKWILKVLKLPIAVEGCECQNINY